MKLMFIKKFGVFAVIAMAALLVFVGGADAQRSRAKQKAVVKRTVAAKPTKDTRKDKRTADKNARDKRNDKHSADKRGNDKRSGKDRADSRSAKDKDPRKNYAAAKKAEAERRRKEAEHRAAIEAERRRREQLAREARARKLAFERGLRTETVANIANDRVEGEDLNIRRAAIEALGSKAGSVVVMEAQTGKVLTVVNQDWAVRSAIRPCSTIKLVTGVAGLNEGVINKEDGSVRNASTRRNLDDAIAFSDNGYFQRVGSNVGNAKMIEYAKKLGLGQPTGINLEGEAAGKLPYGNNNARIYSHGDDFEVSTVQLAVLVSEITNGGKRLIPRIPRNDTEKVRFQPFMRDRLDLPQQNVRRMIPGMMGAAEYGTAHRGVDASLGVAGKTGSCTGKGSWVGLFASVAPIEQPKYAVAVITRGQGERGKYAAAVAGKIYHALSTNIVRTDRNLAQTEFKINKPRVNTKDAEKMADEEDDDGDDSAAANADARSAVKNDAEDGRKVIVVPSAPRNGTVEQPTPKKLVQKTGSSAPIFKPVVITVPKDPNKDQNPDPREKKRERIVRPS